MQYIKQVSIHCGAGYIIYKHTKLLVWLFNTDHVRRRGHYGIIFIDTSTLLWGQLTSSHVTSPYIFSPWTVASYKPWLTSAAVSPNLFFPKVQASYWQYLKCYSPLTKYCVPDTFFSRSSNAFTLIDTADHTELYTLQVCFLKNVGNHTVICLTCVRLMEGRSVVTTQPVYTQCKSTGETISR